MKIIYIHQYFNKPSSSSGTRSYEMARRIAARGHEVHVVTSARGEDAYEFSEAVENFRVHWVPVRYTQRMTYRERLKSFFTFAIRASKLARALRGDLVFATSTPLTVAIPGLIASTFPRRPLVFEVRDLWPDVPIVMGALTSMPARFLARALEKLTYRLSAQIVALSPDMRNAIVSKGIRESKVSVIPNASDNELFQESEASGEEFRRKHGWSDDRKIVLYCGTLGAVNDVSYIVRLAAATKELDDSVLFLVVGKGREEDSLRKKARKLGVYNKNFVMLDPVPKTDVPRVFAAADLSMSTVAPVPLLSANSANKVFDTFASGTPLAINHGGWLAKLIKDNDAGLVLDQSDLYQAAKQLLAFLHSPEKMRSASQGSKKLGTEQFDRQKLADQLGDVLENAHAQWM